MQLQRFWQSYVKDVIRTCEKDLWRVFCSVRKESRVCQTRVLSAVRMVIDPVLYQRWPKDRRALDVVIKRAGSFRTRIIREVHIDLTDQGINKQIEFLFVDPIYAWATTAMHVSRSSPLHFKYCPLYDPETRERLYGSSVKCGEVLRLACEHVQRRSTFDEKLPRGPALFGISWDAGNASKRRSYTPVIVSVGNTDSASSDTCCCIAYLPTLPDHVDSDVRRVMVQRCIGAILKVLHQSASRGFTCILQNKLFVFRKHLERLP